MSNWQNRAFGDTGLSVSALGFGAGHIGSPMMSEDTVATLLNTALDLGIRLIDTARGYGLSEERIGRHIARRRADFVLSTKVGYEVPGYPDWTGPTVTAGIETALRLMRTDYLDIVHLHSCPMEVLQRHDFEVVNALAAAVQAGKIRVAAYSGDNDELDWAAGDARFGSVETSINICDQRVISRGLETARRLNKGVIAKRPIANAPWRFGDERPAGQYVEPYWERWQAMQINPADLDWQELALRFTAYLPGVHSCIVGTGSVEHLRHNIELVQRGPLDNEQMQHIFERFQSCDEDWVGQT